MEGVKKSLFDDVIGKHFMERVTGIGPALVAWEATVLPLNYTRNLYKQVYIIHQKKYKWNQQNKPLMFNCCINCFFQISTSIPCSFLC